jgi:hypothetical protein
MDEIRRLQSWYAAQCDGDWEHDFGVTIESLDNPGWRVRIQLDGTALASVPYEEVTDLAPERDWIHTRVEGTTFHGAGGPHMLDAILGRFLDWADRAR